MTTQGYEVPGNTKLNHESLVQSLSRDMKGMKDFLQMKTIEVVTTTVEERLVKAEEQALLC